jgi:hypothetical protein
MSHRIYSSVYVHLSRDRRIVIGKAYLITSSDHERSELQISLISQGILGIRGSRTSLQQTREIEPNKEMTMRALYTTDLFISCEIKL